MGPVRRRTVVLVSVLASVVALGAAPAVAAPPATSPPAGLRTTSVTSTSVGLAWDPVSGASSYQVLRGTSGGALTAVATTSATSYTDAGRAPGTTYTYAVATVSKKGVSAPSATVTVTTVPAAPTSLTATATSTTTAELGWSAAAGTTSYQVWRGTGSGALQLRTTVAADALTFTDSGLQPATTYRWTVRASNASGTSGDSPVATATTPAPPKVAPTMTITSSADPSAAGDVVTFTVTVSGPNGAAIPTGSVSFTAAGQTSTATLTTNGSASFGRTFGSGGSYPLTASYAGDSRYTAATATGTQTVTAPPPSEQWFGPYAAYSTGSWPKAVVAADVNGDGQAEAVVSTWSYADSPNDYSLLVHDFAGAAGSPAVTRVATGDGYTDDAQLASGDLDGDGYDDVVLGADGSVKSFRGSAAGLGAPAVTSVDGDVRDVQVAELTGDSHLDVVAAVAGPGGGVVRLLPGLGDGTFGPGLDISLAHPSENPPSIAVGDLNGDGHVDVVAVWRSSRTVEGLVDFGLMTGTAAGWDTWRLATLTGSQWPEAVAVGDVTGDGRADAVVTAGGNRPSSQVVVVPTNSTGWGTQSVLPSYDVPEAVVVADVQGGQVADIVVAHGGWNAVGLYVQQVGGALATEQLYDVPYASHYPPRALAVGDVTGDLRPDVLVADYNNGLVVLPGTCPAFCGD